MTLTPHDHEVLNHLSGIDMRYHHGRNNYEIGAHRKALSLSIAGRFSMIAPVLIRPLYGITQRAALTHLNSLVGLGYLSVFHTHRAIDNRLYVLTRDGAAYASELIQYPIPFRSQSSPSLQVNHNTIAHDLMNAYVLLRGVNRVNRNGEPNPLWSGFVTEREFARLYPSHLVRTVDGLVREVNEKAGFAALELENSFKSRALRKTILEKYAYALKSGCYDKVFLFSQQRKIFDDARRLHDDIFEAERHAQTQSKKGVSLTLSDIERLERDLIFRTVFCDELQHTFYP
ncbi:hypothetical protein DRW07_02050 [Alteromonas sediminis]|uniref:Uncharacterized protein n=1 Tax=Alteromonas sediminis TaxID=2259342 RepID=A0A3N5Y4U4_9ALTE|nr:hypothetical protein [Alteromonas sediminis]RPJ68213.1 hypothetical protein DRW07_02050 [Alteromonas sediminis]